MKYLNTIPVNVLKSRIIFSQCLILKKEKQTCRMLPNPFAPNAPFPYPLKTSENFRVFLYFQWVEKGCIGSKRG